MATKDNVQGVVLALFGASAGGHLTALTGTATANGLTALATDLAASAGFILGKDLSTAAAFRDNMLTGLGITSTNAAYAAAAEWADAALAAPGANRGEVVATAVNYLAGLTDSTSPFYAVATTYQATVAAAVAWSEGAGKTVFGVADLQAQQGTTGGAGAVFTLKEVTDVQNFAAFTSAVTVIADGDNNANDGTDFDVTLSAGNDTLSVVEFRNMTVDGGAGTDTLEMAEEAATVNAQRGEAYYTASTANVVEFSNMEVYSLSEAADVFTGGVGNDVVVANGGSDTIAGGAGNDTFKFIDVAELGEINGTAMTGGIGTDTLEIGVTKTSTGYEVDLLAENGTSFGTDIEKLVVTGVSDRDTAVHNSVIKVDSDAGFKQFVGATSQDKLQITAAAAADMSTWSFASIREVDVNNLAAAGADMTVKQAQLDQVERWVSVATNDADITLKAETGATSQTFDLTQNYFKDFAALNESSDIKTTVVADSRTIAGFTAMNLTANDTLKIVGDADLSSYNAGDYATLTFDGAVTLAAADIGDSGNKPFKKIVGTGEENQLTIDTTSAAIDLTARNIAGVKTVVTTSATNGITLSATSVFDSGLQLKNAAPLTLDAAGRLATTTYASFNDISLIGTSKTIKLVGDVSLSQDLLDTATTFNSDAVSTAWVVGEADFSHITSNVNVDVNDTSVDTDIIGMGADATYRFSKGGNDSFTGNVKAETITASATSGSLVADLGDGTNSLTLSKGQELTVSYGASGDNTLDVQTTSSGVVEATFATLTKAIDTTPSITLDLHGIGSQVVTIGDVLNAGSGGVNIDLGGEGDIDLTIGTGFADINMDTAGTGDITITLGDGGYVVSTSAAQEGHIAITAGKNLDYGLTATGDGSINIDDALGTSTIVVGSGGWAITGGVGTDDITGGAGNDSITAGKGGDSIDLSEGGVDTVTLQTGGVSVASSNGTSLSASTFISYATVSGFALGTTDALSDALDMTTATLTASFATNGLNDEDIVADDGTFLYTGTVTSLLNIDDIVAKIGLVNADLANDQWDIFVNNTAGTQFGVYHVTFAAEVNADTIDDLDGLTIELVGVVNGNITAANFEKYVD